MNDAEHYRALERMFLAAPINRFYEPAIRVNEGQAEIEIDVAEKHFHSAGAAHGSVYVHLLDFVAFFAANSLDRESFVFTLSFTTYFTRPLTAGRARSTGKVLNQTGRQFLAEAVLYNEDGTEAGRGNGLFVRGKHPLKDAAGYTI